MALGHPERVTRVALLNIVPTIEQFERMGAGPSLAYWPWFRLARPAPYPEELIGAHRAGVLDYVLDSWTASPGRSIWRTAPPTDRS